MDINREKERQIHQSDEEIGRGGERSSDKDKSSLRYRILLAVTYTSLFVGSVSSSLLSRFYFIHGGSSIWVSTWVQSAGFPLLLLPIYLPRLFDLHRRQPRPFSYFTLKLLLITVGMGLISGLSNFLFSWGIFYLPLSTSSLLLSCQLAFNLILSVLIVKQRIVFSNLNTVVLITLSSILLAIGSSHDRPKGVTQRQYFMGLFAILSTGLLFALYLPLMEMIYKKMVQGYEMVIEMQFINAAVATALASVGMAFDGGFREMRKVSKKSFDLGTAAYGLTVGFSVSASTYVGVSIGRAGLVSVSISIGFNLVRWCKILAS
ncbi:probable purine permease 4 isoform X3 [Macadamia integrifolia]|uniref:probable purine permease 4 isoform X2 n=1 Tax=Macadamia integrifolia TaxID=60698 RepID=UPI001C4EA46B|nr:probable purine permease 4 isoform X2 [Macadamia integrifolia]XP_042512702.1 probable purine permease 4 isoform X3 [Macadamia integrifolia]